MKSFASTGMKAFFVFALLASAQAWAQQSITEQADGSVTISVEGEQFVIPAPIAEEVELAVRDNGDDPEAIRQAIRAIVSQNAGDSESTGLAAAIASLAVYFADTNSSSIAAIGLGVTQGNPGVSGGVVIAAIPALRAEPGPDEIVERELARAQATVENPSQVSPVQ